MKYLPPSHDSMPYRITDALIALFFINTVAAILMGWI